MWPSGKCLEALEFSYELEIKRNVAKNITQTYALPNKVNKTINSYFKNSPP